MAKTVMSVSSAPRRGFTLTEIAIVLGIIGIILGAIWAAAAMVYENNRTKEAREETLTIINNWRSIYGGARPVDLGDSTDITYLTANNGFAPSDMVSSLGGGICPATGATAGCLLSGPWTSSTVEVISYQTTVPNAISVKYSTLSQTACNHLGNSLADAAGLLKLIMPGATYTLPPMPSPSNTSPPTATQISTGCDSSSTSNTLEAVFSMN